MFITQTTVTGSFNSPDSHFSKTYHSCTPSSGRARHLQDDRLHPRRLPIIRTIINKIYIKNLCVLVFIKRTRYDFNGLLRSTDLHRSLLG